LTLVIDKYSLKVDPNQTTEETKKKDLFIIIRSLKNEDGTQKVVFLAEMGYLRGFVGISIGAW